MAKKAIKKEKIVTVKKSSAKLVSYEIHAIIPTGAYANIQPKLVVSSSSIEEAKAFVMPHIEELYNKYFNFTEKPPIISTNKNVEHKNTGTVESPTFVRTDRVVTPKQEPKPTPTPAEKKSQSVGDTNKFIKEQTAKQKLDNEFPMAPKGSESVSEAFKKAQAAILSCTDIKSLEMVTEKVAKSPKLSDAEKTSLEIVIINKKSEIDSK